MDAFDAVMKGAGRVLVRVVLGAGIVGAIVALLESYAPPLLQIGLSFAQAVGLGALFGAASGFRVAERWVGPAQAAGTVVACLFMALGPVFMVLGEDPLFGAFAVVILGAFAIASLVWLALTAARKRGRAATRSR